MKFDMALEGSPRAPAKPQVGDVFKALGSGPKGRRGTRYWLIMSITKSDHGGETVHMAGLDRNGDIVSTTSYGLHAIETRERLGHCPGLKELNLDIVWEPGI